MHCRFNHKTGAEDVHFTSTSSDHESESDADDNDNGYVHEPAADSDEISTEKSQLDDVTSSVSTGNNSDSEGSSVAGGDEPDVLQMIMVKDVAVGSEVSIYFFLWYLLLP